MIPNFIRRRSITARSIFNVPMPVCDFIVSCIEMFINVRLYGHVLRFILLRWEEPDSAVGIANGYGLDDRRIGVLVPVVSRILCSSRRPDRLWGPPSLLSNGTGGKATGA
jgi:hypothetical protein